MQDETTFEELDILLRRRRVPEPSSDLVARIVAAADQRRQKPGFFHYFSEFVSEFGAMLAVPKPAFALAAFLLIGLSAGLFVDRFSVLPRLTPEDLAMFMTIEDRFVAGEWL